MELIDQHTKAIMEGCKERARDAGLRFEDESLEYIVSNRDLLELSPKLMIPTLYDYWVHDVQVLKEKGRYELYPGNPFETVINTRPAISFYNDNNPDWLNVMIFYHVLGHIDFFQNNLFFRQTWEYDLAGQALADKRLIEKLRSEQGRWVDYVIEFARAIDNIVGYHRELSRQFRPESARHSARLDYYFDVFLQRTKKVRATDYLAEIDRYNRFLKENGELGEQAFFGEVARTYPEFESVFQKSRHEKGGRPTDLLQFLIDHSKFLDRDENKWMLSILQIVRSTSLYFQPQIRSKIMNEGWSSYWHEKLFMQDERIRGHEVDFARINSSVTSVPRVGLNPYALGLRLFDYIEQMADRGCYSWDFQRLRDARRRREFDHHRGVSGRDFIFRVRENFCDFTFINNFVDQEFVDRHRLFVTEKELDRSRMVWQYKVKSRRVEDYRQMLFASLYHPPKIEIDPEQSTDGRLYLVHVFEGKPLLQDYIPNTLLGIEFLWGAPVLLETIEPASAAAPASERGVAQEESLAWRRVLYTMENRELTRQVL